MPATRHSCQLLHTPCSWLPRWELRVPTIEGADTLLAILILLLSAAYVWLPIAAFAAHTPGCHAAHTAGCSNHITLRFAIRRHFRHGCWLTPLHTNATRYSQTPPRYQLAIPPPARCHARRQPSAHYADSRRRQR